MKVRSDFVTNSSSSCFICNTSKTPNEVKEVLEKMLEIYNFSCERNLQFHDVFDDPYYYEKNMIPKDNTYAWGYECKDNIGKVLIMSAGDNSIPYALWELIEEAFDAYREHLG
jgi:hypothetical protein